MACLRQLRTEDDVFPMILTFFQRCNVSTHTLFQKYIISLMNIMNNSWSRSNQTTPAFVRNCSKPSFELFVIVLKIEIVLQVRLKNHEKYTSAYQNF